MRFLLCPVSFPFSSYPAFLTRKVPKSRLGKKSGNAALRILVFPDLLHNIHFTTILFFLMPIGSTTVNLPHLSVLGTYVMVI